MAPSINIDAAWRRAEIGTEDVVEDPRRALVPALDFFE
jgi:hypothetical protein